MYERKVGKRCHFCCSVNLPLFVNGPEDECEHFSDGAALIHRIRKSGCDCGVDDKGNPALAKYSEEYLYVGMVMGNIGDDDSMLHGAYNSMM